MRKYTHTVRLHHFFAINTKIHGKLVDCQLKQHVVRCFEEAQPKTTAWTTRL